MLNPDFLFTLVVSGQGGKECFDLLFLVAKVLLGLHIVETDVAFVPIAAGAFGVDGIMPSSRKVAHFVKPFD